MSTCEKSFCDEKGIIVDCVPENKCRACLIKEIAYVRGMLTGAESELSHRENVDKLQRTQISALEAQVRELTSDTPDEGKNCTLGEIHRAMLAHHNPMRNLPKDCTELTEGMVFGFVVGYDHVLFKNQRKITAWREFCDGFKELKEFYKTNVGTADQQTQDGIDAAMEAVQDIINGGK